MSYDITSTPFYQGWQFGKESALANSATQGAFSGSNLGGTLGGIGSVANAGVSIWNVFETRANNKKLLKKMDEQLALQREQYTTEKERYDAREKERLDANKAVEQSASLYDNPMTRK